MTLYNRSSRCHHRYALKRLCRRINQILGGNYVNQ